FVMEASAQRGTPILIFRVGDSRQSGNMLLLFWGRLDHTENSFDIDRGRDQFPGFDLRYLALAHSNDRGKTLTGESSSFTHTTKRLGQFSAAPVGLLRFQH